MKVKIEGVVRDIELKDLHEEHTLYITYNYKMHVYNVDLDKHGSDIEYEVKNSDSMFLDSPEEIGIDGCKNNNLKPEIVEVGGEGDDFSEYDETKYDNIKDLDDAMVRRLKEFKRGSKLDDAYFDYFLNGKGYRQYKTYQKTNENEMDKNSMYYIVYQGNKKHSIDKETYDKIKKELAPKPETYDFDLDKEPK